MHCIDVPPPSFPFLPSPLVLTSLDFVIVPENAQGVWVHEHTQPVLPGKSSTAFKTFNLFTLVQLVVYFSVALICDDVEDAQDAHFICCASCHKEDHQRLEIDLSYARALKSYS